MTEKEKEMMERYIYEVIRRIPREQREDIQMELQELISDMMEEGDADMEKVLTELGSPKKFAQKYRGENNYLIGPEYFEDYIWVLKIVLLISVMSNVISGVVQMVFHSEQLLGIVDYMEIVVENIVVGTITGAVGGFGFITLIFAVMERQKVKLEIGGEKEWSAKKLKAWSPVMLPPVPDKKARISRGDCIVEIVFTVLLCSLLTFAPEWMGAVQINDKIVTFVSPFNLEYWHVILPILLVSMGAALIDSIMKLVTGRYCKTVMISGICMGAVQIVLAAVVLKLLPFWNPDFVEQLENINGIEITSKGDLLTYWNTGLISNILLAGIIIITLAEVATTIYKTLRYGRETVIAGR